MIDFLYVPFPVSLLVLSLNFQGHHEHLPYSGRYVALGCDYHPPSQDLEEQIVLRNLGTIADFVRSRVHRSLLGSFHHLHLLLQHYHESRNAKPIHNSFYSVQITFLAATYATVYLMFFKFRSTYMRESDTFRVELLIIPSALLAVLINHDFSPFELLWTFSIYLEAVAILPQLFLLQSTGSAEVSKRFVSS